MVRGYNLSPWPTSSLNVTTPRAVPHDQHRTTFVGWDVGIVCKKPYKYMK